VLFHHSLEILKDYLKIKEFKNRRS